MSDYQLIAKIRQIESSPSAHRSWKIQQMVEENLRNLRDEAARRGLNV